MLVSPTVFLVIVCAAFFYRASNFEGVSSIVWPGLSVLVSLIVWLWLGGGFWGVLFGQLALFFAITVWRARDRANS